MDNMGSGRFGGDMDRNEVEMDLNKFMAMIQEIGELKDKIRELEETSDNEKEATNKIISSTSATTSIFGINDKESDDEDIDVDDI